MQVSIKKDKCIGCATCVQMANEVFEIVDGKAGVKANVDLDKHKEAIKRASEMCPMGAIEIKE